MNRASSGRTILIVAVVLMTALSGCAGWGADGPAADGVVEGENGPEGASDETGDEGDEESTVEEDPTDAEDGDDDPPDTGSAADSSSADGDGTDADGDEGEPTDAENETTDGTDADDETSDAEGDGNDGTNDDAGDADDGTESDVDEEGIESDDVDETDGGDDTDDGADEPAQEYDAEEFTFVEIAYADAEERPPSSVALLNTHDRSIDLGGWAVTTTEGGEYGFPENTVIEGDSTIAVQFGSDDLTRDGGTLALVDAQGNVVIEDEYGD